MGIELLICHRIVQEHNGQISIRSEWGKFAEFVLTFHLPICSVSRSRA